MIFRTLLRWLLSAILSLVPLAPYGSVWAQAPLNLPQPGVMVGLSTPYNPPVFRGLTVDPQNPFTFRFIMDTGDELFDEATVGLLSERLSRYFLASLTIPEEDLWVNLSPYESDRIVPEALGRTQMGRDMLAQDYVLKQLSASLLHPDEALGAAFWDRVRQEAYERFGTTDIPVETVNKVWIIPDYADVYEDGNTVVILDAKLKVLLEEDYEALEQMADAAGGIPDRTTNDVASLSTQVLREIIIPALEEEVNTGRNFTELRQVYHSLILATWYKEALLNSVLARVYADKERTDGITTEDPAVKQKIYEAYLEAFEKGVYNFIKEDWDEQTGDVMPRKYFSGGEHLSMEGKLRRHGPQSGWQPGQGFKGSSVAVAIALGVCTGAGCSTTPMDQSGSQTVTSLVVSDAGGREAYAAALSRVSSSLSDGDIGILLSEPMRFHTAVLPQMLNQTNPSEAHIDNLARMASQTDDTQVARLLIDRLLFLGAEMYRDNPGPIASALAKQKYAGLTSREHLDSARFLLQSFYHPQVNQADVVNAVMDILALNSSNPAFLEKVIPIALAVVEEREVTDTSVYSREMVNVIVQAASGMNEEQQRKLAPRLESVSAKVLLNPFQGLMGRWDVASYTFDGANGRLHLNGAMRIPSKTDAVEVEFQGSGRNIARTISLSVQPFDVWQSPRFSDAQKRELQQWMAVIGIPRNIPLYSIRSTDSARFHRVYGAAAEGTIFLRQEILERATPEQMKEALFHEHFELQGMDHDAIRESQARIFSTDGGLSDLIHSINREDKVYLASLAERMTLESLDGVRSAAAEGDTHELTEWLGSITELGPYISSLSIPLRQTFFKTLVEMRQSSPAVTENVNDALEALLAPEALPLEVRASLAMEIRNNSAPVPAQYENFVAEVAVQVKRSFQAERVDEAAALLKTLTPHLSRLTPQARQTIASLSADVSSVLQDADMYKANQTSDYERVHEEMRGIIGFMEELLVGGNADVEQSFRTLISAEAVDFDIRTMAAEALLNAYSRAVTQREYTASGRIIETLMDAYPFSERPDPVTLRVWLGFQGPISEVQRRDYIKDLNTVAGVNAEMGYAMLERVRGDALLLSDIVNSPGLNIQARLYAYGLLAGQHRLASELTDEFVARAEDFVQDIGELDGRQLNDRLLNKPFVRDHLRTIGAAIAVVGHRSPKIPGALRDRMPSLAVHMDQVWSIRFLRGYDNATSLYEIGHRLVEQSGDVLVLTIAHEQGHNVLDLDFALPPQDLTTQALHEVFADLYAETIADALDIPAEAFRNATHAEGAHRSVVTYFDGIAEEPHDAGRAQLEALRKAYPSEREFPTAMLMEIMVRQLAMYQSTQLMRPHLRAREAIGWQGPSFYETMRLVVKMLAERSTFQVVDETSGADPRLAQYSPGVERVKVFAGEPLGAMFKGVTQNTRRRPPSGFLTSILGAMGLMGRWDIAGIDVDGAERSLTLRGAKRLTKEGESEVEPEFADTLNGIDIALATRPLAEVGNNIETGLPVPSVIGSARNRLGIPEDIPIEAIAYDSTSAFYRIYGAAAGGRIFLREDLLREGTPDEITEAVDHEYRELTKGPGVTHDDIRAEQTDRGLSRLIHDQSERDKKFLDQATKLVQDVTPLTPSDWRLARDIYAGEYQDDSDDAKSQIRGIAAALRRHVDRGFLSLISDQEVAVIFDIAARLLESDGDLAVEDAEADAFDKVLQVASTRGSFTQTELVDQFPGISLEGAQLALAVLQEAGDIRQDGDRYQWTGEPLDAAEKKVGGVDFNTRFLKLQRSGRGGADFSGVSVEDIEGMNPTGFVPILLDIQPLPALPLLSQTDG